MSTAPTAGGNYTVVQRINFSNGQPGQLAVGGTPLESSEINGYTAAYCYSTDPLDTFVFNQYGYDPECWAAQTGNAGEWIGYQFNEQVFITNFSITASGDVNGGVTSQNCFTSFNLEYSDDGQTWTTAASFTPSAWSADAVQQFIVPYSFITYSNGVTSAT